ncbi:MAG: response regulator [Methylacidiphilales bacterium]|nr:response regulator [Candidatus Methylacidiphilales bacterium]
MKTPRILLVDDSKATRAIVAKMLRSYDCEILEAANGALGVESARQHQPDLIVLDMTMPVMNGVETLQTLQADETLKSIPVIMLTANSNPEEIEQMKALGAAEYITKTQKPRLILEKVIALIGLQAKPGEVPSEVST